MVSIKWYLGFLKGQLGVAGLGKAFDRIGLVGPGCHVCGVLATREVLDLRCLPAAVLGGDGGQDWRLKDSYSRRVDIGTHIMLLSAPPSLPNSPYIRLLEYWLRGARVRLLGWGSNDEICLNGCTATPHSLAHLPHLPQVMVVKSTEMRHLPHLRPTTCLTCAPFARLAYSFLHGNLGFNWQDLAARTFPWRG